jgi:hypothetical protein
LSEKLLRCAADRRRVEQNGKSTAGADRWRVPTPDGPVGGASSELPLPTGDSRCLVVRAAAAELLGRGAAVSVDCGARVRADRHSAAAVGKGMAGWEDWERTGTS